MRYNMRPDVEEVEGIDLDFTPQGYFTAHERGALLPSDIKGQARRDLARSYAAKGMDPPQWLLVPELPEALRREWGAIHPSFMGGEYLSPPDRDEVEIVRISLASTTGDTISLRARRQGKRIAYRIIDENPTEDGYDLEPKTSVAPLSMRRLVNMLDCACIRGGAVLATVVWNLEDRVCDADRMRGFVSVESDFYPQLGEYYETRLTRWLDQWEAAHPED
jgi:hypothetical protein